MTIFRLESDAPAVSSEGTSASPPASSVASMRAKLDNLMLQPDLPQHGNRMMARSIIAAPLSVLLPTPEDEAATTGTMRAI